MAAPGHEYVRRLDVTVNDTLGMSCLEPFRSLNGKVEELTHLERTVGDAVLQRCPFQKLHRDAGLGFMLPDLVNCADIGMIQGRGSARFPSKAFEGLCVPDDVVGDKL